AQGVVPARAGVDLYQSADGECNKSGPRASGGGPVLGDENVLGDEWSPRERGWTVSLRMHGPAVIVVPARAGVDPALCSLCELCSRGPRASGGGPESSHKRKLWFLWSPRERGWTEPKSPSRAAGSVVPARAGVDLLPMA